MRCSFFLSSAVLMLTLSACASAPDAVPGYLDQPLAFQQYLPAPPQVDTPADSRDLMIFNQMNAVPDGDRWLQANLDAAAYDSDQLLERFRDALGVPATAELSRDTVPHLLALLDRAQSDAGATVRPAKQFYNRARPIYRLNIDMFCHANITVQTDHGDSYPSGHATRGWQAALILARVAPDHAPEILARGRVYGDSRVVCRVHYPSDVVAGDLLATALVEREAQTGDFQHDIDAARAELAALLK